MTKLSIIVLNYNTKSLTLECIRSVISNYRKELNNKEFELIVVDNASSDSSVQALRSIKQITLIENKANYGFSKGNNIGAKKASGEYILFLNSDTLVKDQGFIKMMEFMDKNEKIGVLGGKLLNPDGSQQSSCGNFYSLINVLITLMGGERVGLMKKKSKRIEKVDWVMGALMMVRRKLFEDIKGFDESLFMYIEDMELCFRIKKIGLHTYFYPDVKVVHKELGSSNRTFAILNIYKGILIFYKKHSNWQYPLVKIILFLKAFLGFTIGIFTNNDYLKKTYGGALKIAL